MKHSEDILNELQVLSPVVAAIEKLQVYTVPAGYFDYLAADILVGIHAGEGSAGDAAIDATGKVPAGYFDALAGSIISKIKSLETEDAAAEIRALSPLLYSIQNENVFSVPAGYFEGFSETVLNSVNPQVKVVSMKRRTTAFFKYAVAAAFTGMMALGVFKFTGNSNNKIELPAYVTAGLQVQDVDGELDKIADADIAKFLEADATDVKAAFVANSVDVHELPATEDYLMDDKTLDKYLNSINVNDLKN